MAKILLIEDHLELRENTRKILGLHDHEVLAFADGESALGAMAAFGPDLVLCDISLPGIDGHEVLRRIRQNESALPVPFVFLSALASRDDVRQGMSIGADDYLTKPFTMDELTGVVTARLAGIARLREANVKINADFERQKLHCLPHEIRTPLNGILGGLSLLRSDLADASADIHETMDIMEISAQRLERTMLNYVLHAEMVSGRYALSNPVEIALQPWIQAVCHAVVAFHGREHDLQCSLISLTQSIPKDALEKVLSEVLSNAAKFSDPSTTIHVQMEASPSHWAVVIDDEGRGMTASEIASIGPFQQFQRDHWEQQGLGLGLEICRRISTLAGWEFAVSNAPAGGLRVRLVVPIKIHKW